MVSTLNRSDIELLTELHALLKPFHVTIMKLQKDKEFTSPIVYGELMELLDHTARFQSDFQDIIVAAKALNIELKRRFGKFLQLGEGSIPTYIIASLLDPSHGFLLHEFSISHLITLLQNEVCTKGSSSAELSTANPRANDTINENGSFAQRMKDKRRLTVSNAQESNPEFEQVKSFVNFSMNCDDQKSAYSYWPISGIQQFPLIVPVAQKYFCLQATTAAIERSFSLAGIATKGRKSNTKARLLNARLLVHLNSKFAHSISL